MSELNSDNDIKLEIGLLKRDIAVFDKYFQKIDTTLEKLGEVSEQIHRLVVLHDDRIESHQKESHEIKELIERRRVESAAGLNDLEKKFEDSEKRIRGSIDTLRTDIVQEITNNKADQDKRLNKLEIWRYIIIGGTIVVMFFFGEIWKSFVAKTIDPQQQQTIIQQTIPGVPKPLK